MANNKSIQFLRKTSGAVTDDDIKSLLPGQPLIDFTTGILYVGTKDSGTTPGLALKYRPAKVQYDIREEDSEEYIEDQIYTYTYTEELTRFSTSLFADSEKGGYLRLLLVNKSGYPITFKYWGTADISKSKKDFQGSVTALRPEAAYVVGTWRCGRQDDDYIEIEMWTEAKIS